MLNVKKIALKVKFICLELKNLFFVLLLLTMHLIADIIISREQELLFIKGV